MNQRGFTMVELLIGLVLSTIVSLAMLMFYKQSLHASLDSTHSAEIDTKIQTSLISIKKAVHIAGFGNGAQEDIILDEFELYPAVLWRYAITLDPDDNTGTSFNCRGVSETIEDDLNSDRKIHRILLIKKDTCDLATELEDGTWEVSQQLASITSDKDTPYLTFDLDSSPGCTPFGIDPLNGTGMKVLTITSDAPPINATTTLCLVNITAEPEPEP